MFIPVSLCLLGLLSAVTNLNGSVQGSTISLTWNAPFSLDISGVTGYCVDIIDTISSSIFFSQCEINTTRFSYTLSGCQEHVYTVTPVNVVGNGTSLNYSQEFGCEIACLFFV